MSTLSRTVALVTGGSSGLGAAAARMLVRNGARVVVADLGHQRENFLQMARSCGEGVSIVSETTDTAVPSPEVLASGPAVAFCEADVTVPDRVEAALDCAERLYGEPVNVAVNCAGIAIAKKTLSRKGPHPLEDFTKVVMVNTIGTFNVSRLAAERMSTRDPEGGDGIRGCIINTASTAGYEGQIGQVAYAASKGGVIGMTLTMARDLASYGIRVMTIAPGLFETPLMDGLPEKVKAELGATVPLPNRLGQPNEFGQVVESILTTPMLNGSVIRIDGGLRMPP